ncbi:MAG: arginine N-succinyltransferase [Marinobacterium sp.]|nr:arginine N-succinyltransferase [Marinobacterium sp.]
MMVIRPLRESDWPAFRALASKTGTGFTSLQDDDVQARGKFEAGLAGFQLSRNDDEEVLYLFVLEDTETGTIAGVCGIESAVGLGEPWYNYRLGTIRNTSRELNVSSQLQTLTITNDHTGHSEVCTLFLDPEYRHSKNGSLLSKSRFLFMAEHPHLFHDNVIAEMRGYSDENGVSPFWEGLGRHFFTMDFACADRQSSMNKVFIAELMPRHAIYTNLLPQDAQAVICQTHKDTVPARKLLEAEGMDCKGYCDIFDGGPLLEAKVQDIRAVRDSRYMKVRIVDEVEAGDQYLVATTGLQDFACTLVSQNLNSHQCINLTPALAKGLNVSTSDTVRVVPLSASQRF